MRLKKLSLLLALTLLVSVSALPVTAHAGGSKDTTPPTLTASLEGDALKIESSDDLSGVEAVFVDENRINSLTDGKASVALKDYAGTEKQVSIYAKDYAGNRSDVVKLDNPYYKEPAPEKKPATTAPQSPSGYLNHLYDGTYNRVGCLFADYENRADFSDRNTIIYGHNMRDGSMFALLNRYDEQSYFDTHRQMYLVTPKGGYVMEIFTAFAAKPEESGSETSPWQLSWKDDGAYTTWLTAMKERSAVESDVTVTCSDKVLTLSTCTPGGTGRFLVMGKLVKVDNEI